MTEHAFVARERELARLQMFLDQALTGNGQICFVAGEAGAGKTALVTEFARRAQVQHDDLIVTIGVCDAQTGIGDAYLPFREILELLTGDVDAKLAQGIITQENANRLRSLLNLSGEALVEHGPDLVDLFIPGAGLVMRAGKHIVTKVGWTEKLKQRIERRMAQETVGGAELDQSQIFEQYTNTLRALVARRPLMLVLDDLHWADEASIALLFRLSRRLENNRILMVGTYRPDELALGRAGKRHPLDKVLAELRRYYGDILVDLDDAQAAQGRAFVDAYLDNEPNRLDEGFREALFQHTGGHPLFTVELLRDMQAQGDLARDAAGRWIEGPALDWERLPPKIEGVIEGRIGRLDEDLRETLTIASVEGEDFTLQVLARIRQIEERELARQLSRELGEKHRLVEEQGRRQVGDQRLYLYRFRHSLFQQHLYQGLGMIERELLHWDVGTVLEELYGEQIEDIAPELAWHFTEGHHEEKALTYRLLAGDVALRSYAYQEAKQHYDAAMQLLSRVPTATVEQRLRLYEGLGHVHSREMAVHFYRQRLSLIEGHLDRTDPATRRLTAETERWIALAYRNVQLDEMGRWLIQASATLGEPWDRESTIEMARLLGAQAWLSRREGNYDESLGFSNKALTLIKGIDNPRLEMTCCYISGLTLCLLDRWQDALTTARHIRSLNQEIGDKRREYHMYELLGLAYWPLGELAEAREAFSSFLRAAQSLGYDRLSYPKMMSGLMCLEMGDLREAERWLVEAATGFDRRGGQWFHGWALSLLGTVYHRTGRLREAELYLGKGIERWRESDVVQSFNLALTYQADLVLDLNRLDEAEKLLKESLVLSQEMHTPWVGAIAGRFLGRAYRLKGELTEAGRHLVASIETHERLGSQVERGRSLCEYGRLQRAMGNDGEARALFEQAKDIFAAKGARHDLAEAEEALAG